MQILIISALLSTLLSVVRAQCPNIQALQSHCSFLMNIKIRLENQIADMQFQLNQLPFIDQELNLLNAAVALLQQKPCNGANGFNQLDGTLQNQLLALQGSVEGLDALVKQCAQQANMFQSNYQRCFSQLQISAPGGTCPVTGPPTKPPDAPTGSCVSLGYYTGITTIILPGVSPFNVYCDSMTGGPGWLVIQNRFNGSENFYRSWAEYREGFGHLSGEFFLGLERIYRLTNYQRYELYIYVQSFNNENFWARYDNFYIGSEAENYKIKSVGQFTGMYDRLSKHVGVDFSTYDRENSAKAFAKKYHGGYWYYEDLLEGSNLNGKYYQTDADVIDSLHWYHMISNKVSRMMIRPLANV